MTLKEDWGAHAGAGGGAEDAAGDGKLNLSWTKYFPACSTQPWQLEGALNTLFEDGYDARHLFPVENRTVVTDPRKGAINNKWMPVLERYGLPFIPLMEVEWIRYEFKSPRLKLNEIFPDGIEIPKMYVTAWGRLFEGY
ncbi:MAG: hypothetical protein AABZ20_03540 [candidate division NC10 bacterium]|mgnify:CR=1 FL=1